MNLWIIIFIVIVAAERLAKVIAIEYFFYKHRNTTDTCVNISILQPILSGDPTLSDCLEQNIINIARENIEFVWLVDDNDPTAQQICGVLKDKHPKADIHIVSQPAPPRDVNPKTFKLIKGVEVAKHEFIAVLDDDTILPTNQLQNCARHLNKQDIGMCFGLPYYLNHSNLWSSLVSCFVNSNSLLTYVPYTFLIDPITVNGMFYVVNKQELQSFGGFASIKNQLCDDFAVANLFLNNNKKLMQTPLLHGISTQVNGCVHYHKLISRWMIFIKETLAKDLKLPTRILFFLVIMLPSFVGPSLLIYACIQPGMFSGGLLAGYALYCYSIFMYLSRRFLNSSTPLLHTLLQPFILFVVPFQFTLTLISGNTINWRGHVMRVKKSGQFEFVKRREEE
ncbi:glycosyltransferase family 2 protein [Candidatus Uabimicrobium amorphum]|uniref:Ceramide glucosyltransferase n=1 Tax=Uabimicrobium amorphum TaxID=2596890 RepID=A0A5S9IHU0_UABAM|nr:glycosyltransferase family 2 protein [Candidatus Uabimicrobium amorphum]BBM82078.1 ceramide glucosyltransferase [Candidatus Uabimicrobium amorphum]